MAIKLLRRDDPDSVARMIREARAQARVHHPNVARVYETGELDGRPYIAMQLVDGEPLDEACADLPIEHKVRLVRTVAEAVHAAHELGLVHRDLKPSNILVEERDDGELDPYVLDFGIARERDVEGLTATGLVVGTPGYMSPEQAAGDPREIDRRSDVFALGIVLYELLSGRLPFTGETSIEMFVELLQKEPPPLHKVAPHVPVDLATIVMRCLEREPSRRYQSARALSEDLGRFLAGEAIAARPASILYRVRRRVARHPVAVPAVGVALLALIALAAWSLHTRRESVERARIAQNFGERVERIDHLMRLAHLSPLHDLRPDRALVEEEMKAIELEMSMMGELAAGPGHAALGRALLSLDRPDEARVELERALDLGFHEAEVRLALGVAIASIHARELRALDRLSDADVREAERGRLEEELASRARQLILEAREGADLAAHELAYVDGLLALEEGRLEEAAEHGSSASRTRSWFHEGDLLAGEAAMREASRAVERGEPGRRRPALVRARSAYSRVVAAAPSDPAARLGMCRSWYLEMLLLDQEEGEAPDTAYERSIRRCDEALTADPERADALLQKAEAAWSMGKVALRRGDDPGPFLDVARSAATKALEVDPDSAPASTQLGNVELIDAQHRRNQGEDPAPALERAIDHLWSAFERSPGDGLTALSLGHALQTRGFHRLYAAGDPSEEFLEAISVYRRGLPVAGPLASRFHSAICSANSDLGYYRIGRGRDAGGHFERAIESCRRAIELSPDYLGARNNLGVALWSRAEHLRNTGRGDATEAYEAAAEAFEKLLVRDPDRSSANVNLAHILIDLADQRLDREIAPPPHSERIRELLERVREVYPDDFALLRSKLALVEARWDLHQDERSGEEALREALRFAERAADLRPEHTFILSQLAGVHREIAARRLAAGDLGSARRHVASGLEVVERVLDIDEDFADALAHEAALRWMRSRVSRGEEAERAVAEAREVARRVAEARVDLARRLPPDLLGDG